MWNCKLARLGTLSSILDSGVVVIYILLKDKIISPLPLEFLSLERIRFFYGLKHVLPLVLISILMENFSG